MKLYDIPRESKIKVDEGMITFHHLDGMYSFCTFDWIESPNNICHLSVNTELVKVQDYYVFKSVHDKEYVK